MTLRIKLLTMATALLAAFAAATGLTAWLIDGVMDEMETIAQYQLPINRAIATIDVLTYEYELRLRRTVDEDIRSADELAKLKTDQAHTMERMNAAAAQATDLLEAGRIDSRNNAADQRNLSLLLGTFRYLARNLAPFETAGKKVETALDAGNMAEARAALAGFRAFEASFGPDIAEVRRMTGLLAEESTRETAENQKYIYEINGVLFLAAGSVGLALFFVLTGRLQRAFRQLVDGTKAIERGQFAVSIPVGSKDEIGQLAGSFNRMARQLEAKQKLQDTFGKFLDPRIVPKLVDEEGRPVDSAERRIATVFFSDIKGFTQMSEQLTATSMVNLLNNYFTTVVRPIRARNGIVDKFIGDAVMAFWTTPFSPGEQHAVDGCVAAIEQQRAIAAFRPEIPHILGLRRNVPEFKVRMGLATGEIVIGTIGSDQAKSYTVIGDTVNFASRLEGANKVYGTEILVSEETYRLSRESIEAREIDSIMVVGKTEPVRIYEVLGLQGQVAKDRLELCERFQAMLTAYRARDWIAAARGAESCLALEPGDGPSQVFAARVRQFKLNPPPESWDGVFRLTEK